VGKQIGEAIQVHDHDISDRDLRARVVELLDIVGIPDPAARAEQYPHEYSGGMRQRAMIAMSIANEPDVLIADEPTTALDVTIQAQVLEVMERIQDRTSSSIMLITHDLGVVASMCDRVNVMYAGRIVETGQVREIFRDAHMPYTWGLLDSLPRIDAARGRLRTIDGLPPDLSDLGERCRFAPRCSYARQTCREAEPELLELGEPGHLSRCWGTQSNGWVTRP
jgi:oligopeptide/dipeptide ABC transporter ATP-binding protein